MANSSNNKPKGIWPGGMTAAEMRRFMLDRVEKHKQKTSTPEFKAKQKEASRRATEAAAGKGVESARKKQIAKEMKEGKLSPTSQKYLRDRAEKIKQKTSTPEFKAKQKEASKRVVEAAAGKGVESARKKQIAKEMKEGKLSAASQKYLRDRAEKIKQKTSTPEFKAKQKEASKRVAEAAAKKRLEESRAKKEKRN